MCGIFGTFSFSGPVDLMRESNRLNLLEHRGPDGFGFEYGDFRQDKYTLKYNEKLNDDSCSSRSIANYFFGHRRLSIIDLHETAAQPMESGDSRYSIVFNGEIYNYVELRKELLDCGCSFKTDHSDTEVLLNAYAIWGEDCLSRLRGMFAFAIFDRSKKELFLARDRIGQKNVYYELNDEEFIFSSEIAPMVRFCNTSRRINLTSLSYYILLGYVPYPLSIFDGINKLPPASWARIDLGQKEIVIKEYWDIDFDQCDNRSVDEIEQSIESSLATSIELRLRADVPVGAFISGGIDSSLVVKKIKEVGKKPFDIFGADFPQPEKSERKYIEQVASKYDQRLNISAIDIDHIESIKGVIDVFDEPFDGGSSVALYDLFKHASDNYKVILTGDGGDELFVGYDRYREFPKLHAFFSKLDKLIIPQKILKVLLAAGIKSRKLSKLSRVISSNIATSYLNYNRDFSLLKILKSPAGEDVEKLAIFDQLKEKIESKNLSSIKSLQYLELKTILPGRMLYKLDRFSMAYGVEARSPFLDHHLVEMAFSIPEEHNIDENGGKVLPKRILERDFPHDFVYRKKQGFGNPFSAWFSASTKRHVFDVLNDEDSIIFEYLSYDQLHKKFPQFKNGYNGESEKEMWRFVVLANYLNNFSDIIKT